ncbi:NAD(P)/FAD-dependent oxidoreductase [Saccharopolyspora elongata]|uniref:NAD(P)/FAD-dependent oxidoreductase n=1 Tax=Saccharopolyspora elongata TaxID=2530387 RepID=A0A4V2YMS5_9PSEU|nr:FAD-dependent oxidoreductase [Saccharopolyspora elongata]TDD51637.1 NAD(P)/FAD-dependent oxidoreductase [Saccharopolyspora elongata]
MSAPAGVLVVGASAAGIATADALRRKGYHDSLTLLGAESHLPYDRPPLSKQVLSGTWEAERVRLRSPEKLAELDADIILGDPAVGLDPATRTVRTASGRTLTAGTIVVATGLRPRTLPGQDGLTGVHVLRTVDDSLALRSALLSATRVVVVGDGVLGTEIAATARGMGADVTLVGPQPAPMASQFGTLVGGLLGELHAERGVRLRLGAAVDGLTGRDGRVTGVRLDTGDELPADVVVVALGAAPATEWLAESGLQLDNGLVCDSRCRAAEGIYGAGDVARWQHDALGVPLRLENRTNATMQANAVAANILGEDQPYSPVPHFWTDQYDTKIQVHGLPTAAAEATIVDGDPADGRFVAMYHRDGEAVGVLGWNMPKQTRLRRGEVVEALSAPVR